MMNRPLRTVILLSLGLSALSAAKTLYISPAGTATATGTEKDPTTLHAAVTKIAAGDTILVQDGTYKYSDSCYIDSANSGTANAMKHIFAAPGAHPVFDFSTQTMTYPPAAGSNPRGIQINGNYWHLRGLSVTKAADNGIYIAGSHNIVEGCITFANYDTGLQLGRAKSTLANISQWPSYNLILNCESYDNFDDPAKLVGGTGGAGENADGFACKLTTGPGNVFRGCIAHNNSDDGWDLFTKTETGGIGPVTLDRCIAHHNGTLTHGSFSPNGDMNGFKLGGSDMANEHFVSHCVSYANGKNGFTWNSNPGKIQLSNNLAFDNVQGNYKFDGGVSLFWNNVSFITSVGTAVSDKHVGTDVDSSNCWWDKSKKQPSISGKGLIVTAADFVSDLTKYSNGSIAPTRLADSAIDLSPFGLASGSDLIDVGSVVPAASLPIGVTYPVKAKPDLGPVETGITSGVVRGAAPLMDRFGFASPRSGTARLGLFDATGRKLADLPLNVVAGSNRISVPAGIRHGAMFATIELGGDILYRGRLLLPE